MKAKVLITFAPLTILVGCAVLLQTGTYTYTPPTSVTPDKSKYTRVVKASFDHTWKALVDHCSTTFFGIEGFEKDSGLMILSFGASNPSEFVDGGHWESSSFTGNYVDYCVENLNGQLVGKMNITVTELAPDRTQVRVNTRYIFSATSQQLVYQPYVGPVRVPVTDTWAFDTGGSATKRVGNPTAGTIPTRTMRPTHKAENTILEAIENLVAD